MIEIHLWGALLTCIRDALGANGVRIVAIFKIIGGKAIKGPTEKLIQELGIWVTDASIASHCDGVIQDMVQHESDSPPTIRVRTKREAIALAQSL